MSKTPSTRASTHLALLSELHLTGHDTMCAFVLQRPDVDYLLIGGDADAGWLQAVRQAHEAGVRMAAFACDVTEKTVTIRGPVELRFQP